MHSPEVVLYQQLAICNTATVVKLLHAGVLIDSKDQGHGAPDANNVERVRLDTYDSHVMSLGNLETYPRNIDARLSLDLRYAYAARQYGSIGGSGSRKLDINCFKEQLGAARDQNAIGSTDFCF
ncbi:hypothetical protein TWF173_005258 [Orbilia oligospora]|nr:hypothetical protein TWF173_005258 [Orbilia oligospora]